jgi:hypothetical protein
VIQQRGNHHGLVWIFSAMEPCPTYNPWFNKETGKTHLTPDDGKCVHYYFYFIDEELGLCYVRVPTWLPCRLQIYFNGHNWLAAQLKNRGIHYTMLDNSFAHIEDWARAQRIADGWEAKRIHRKLEELPPLEPESMRIRHRYRIPAAGGPASHLREPDRTAIHTVKPDNVATFPGKKLTGHYQDEMCHLRIEGTRIKHTMGPVSIKMYGKFGLILRIETTVMDVSFFRHYRRVEHRNGKTEMKNADMCKTMYSLPALRELLVAANRRYLEFISAIDDDTAGTEKLTKLSQSVEESGRCYRGFNFFDHDDQVLFESLARGEFNISGFQAKNPRARLKNKTCGQISRLMKRLRTHGLIKKVGKTYKYYLTAFGKQAITLGPKLKDPHIIPNSLALLRSEIPAKNGTHLSIQVLRSTYPAQDENCWGHAVVCATLYLIEKLARR